MTKQDVKRKLEIASALIFEVEEALSNSSQDGTRRIGYRARIGIGEFQDAIHNCRNEDDISKYL